MDSTLPDWIETCPVPALTAAPRVKVWAGFRVILPPLDVSDWELLRFRPAFSNSGKAPVVAETIALIVRSRTALKVSVLEAPAVLEMALVTVRSPLAPAALVVSSVTAFPAFSEDWIVPLFAFALAAAGVKTFGFVPAKVPRKSRLN